MPMPFYVKIQSEKQGTLAGDVMTQERKDWTNGLDFRYELSSAHDPVTAMPTGHIQHSLTFAKRWSRSSAQLFGASINNEVLTNVTFEFVWPANANAAERVFQRITVEQATVLSMRQTISEGSATELEEIGLAFQRITLDNLLAGGPTLTPVFAPAVVGTISPSGPTPLPVFAPPVVGDISFSRGGTQTQPSTGATGSVGWRGTGSGNVGIQLPSSSNLPKWGRLGSGRNSPGPTIG